ncbi:cbb3-type cytochrome oxidase assembly protein CcoS [uncultured Planktosalinus sp.]|uniref:cbb3-type cytochrome oxidase assembly protein CcoS n=1 Tax=uncultured Planktosalinus sp. TaxID=1810935 RepID=UPI0030DB9096
MNIIYLTLIISTLVAIVFFVIFIFSLKKGQYDDTYTPSVRMLFDDELVKDKSSNQNKEHKNTSKTNKSTTNKSDF